MHYQVPASADLYVHRSGRTARAAQDGVAVTLVTPTESRRWDALQTALQRPAAAVPEFPVVRPPRRTPQPRRGLEPAVGRRSSCSCNQAWLLERFATTECVPGTRFNVVLARRAG